MVILFVEDNLNSNPIN